MFQGNTARNPVKRFDSKKRRLEYPRQKEANRKNGKIVRATKMETGLRHQIKYTRTKKCLCENPHSSTAFISILHY